MIFLTYERRSDGAKAFHQQYPVVFVFQVPCQHTMLSSDGSLPQALLSVSCLIVPYHHIWRANYSTCDEATLIRTNNLE